MNLQSLLDRFAIRVDVRVLLDKWSESHRHYHNLNHLNDLVAQINESLGDGDINENERDKLLIAALFHDIVYEPDRKDNEERSSNMFINLCGSKDHPSILEINRIILDTKNHQPSSKLSEKFMEFDMNIVERDFDELLEWEEGIREEYKMYSNEDYKNGRLEFLESVLYKYPHNMDNLLDLIGWVKSKY